MSIAEKIKMPDLTAPAVSRTLWCPLVAGANNMLDAFPHPVFSDKYIRMLRLCGRLETDDAAILEAVSSLGEDTHTFSCGQGDDAEFFVLFGGSSSGGDKKHVHLDIVRDSYFEASEPPQISSSEREVGDVWKRFFGQRVNVAVTGRFIAPLADFTPDSVVTRMSEPRDVSGAQLQQTGADFEFSSGPLDGFNWTLSRKTKLVRAQVKLTLDDVINETYPKRMYEYAVGIFRRVIMGDKAEKADVR